MDAQTHTYIHTYIGTCKRANAHTHRHMNNDTFDRMYSLLMRDNPRPAVPQWDQWHAAICLFYLHCHNRFPEVC